MGKRVPLVTQLAIWALKWQPPTKNKSSGFQCLELAGCRGHPCSGPMLSRNPSTAALREGKGPQVSMYREPLKDGLPASEEAVHTWSRCGPRLGPSTLLMVLQGASIRKADGRGRPEAAARDKSNSHTFWASTMVRKQEQKSSWRFPFRFTF